MLYSELPGDLPTYGSLLLRTFNSPTRNNMKKMRWNSFCSLAFLLSIITLLTTTEALAQPGNWVKLGSRKVNYTLDRDEIAVGRISGTFSKLMFEVNGGGINMHKVVVVYGNGSRDELELKHDFGRGENTRVIDLRGNGRVIRSISFWYDTKNYSGNKATLVVYGRR